MNLKKLDLGCILLIVAGFPAFALGCRLTLPAEQGNDSQVGPGSDAAAALDVQVDAGQDGGVAVVDSGPDAGPDAVVDHSDQLPTGVSPPVLWFWRGIHQNNLSWYTDESGRHCGDGDTTMWFHCADNQVPGCGGAPACDPDHFATETQTCMGDCCCWRNWDDPRGPEYRVSGNTGPVEIHNWGAQGTGGSVPDFGFGVTLCALPGTTAVIDTCPRLDVYSCVQDRYPQWVDDCTTVLLTVSLPPAQYDPSLAGCYSTKADVTITF